MTFVSFGGVYQEAQRKAWLEPYTELTGVQFTEDENSSNATIKAQVESGQVTWDVVDVGNDFGLDGNSDLLEPLDYSLIQRDEMNQDLGVSDYRVPDMTYGVVSPTTPTRPRARCPRAGPTSSTPPSSPASAALGLLRGRHLRVRPDGRRRRAGRPVPARPRAGDRKLDTIKDDIVFWDSGAESQELIGSGEVAMSMIWNGRGWSAKHIDNKPVEIQWNQQIVTADYFVVPKGSPNKDAAMEFIA